MPAGAPAHNHAHNYATDIEHQREVWKRKPALRAIYTHWYAQCVEALAKHQPTVEVGCGSGNFKAFYRESIATDVLIGTGAELVADAMALPLAKDKTGNIVAFDVIHHLQRPLRFLRQAMAVLKPGGRLVLCEPAMSLWSKLVFRYFHHEPFDLPGRYSISTAVRRSPIPAIRSRTRPFPRSCFGKSASARWRSSARANW